jgi:hypothetical protein
MADTHLTMTYCRSKMLAAKWTSKLIRIHHLWNVYSVDPMIASAMERSRRNKLKIFNFGMKVAREGRSGRAAATPTIFDTQPLEKIESQPKLHTSALQPVPGFGSRRAGRDRAIIPSAPLRP